LRADRFRSQNVGAYFPKTSCIAPQTSPSEQRSFSAWRIVGNRLSAPRDDLVAAQASPHGLLVAVGLEGSQAGDLFALGLGIDAQQVGDLDVVLLVLVDADDDVWPMR
jgi:hypothetical protein